MRHGGGFKEVGGETDMMRQNRACRKKTDYQGDILDNWTGEGFTDAFYFS